MPASEHPYRKRKFHYRYAGCFMERGGIYGRAREYPVTAGKVQRVFRTAIHISFREPDFRRNSANSQAFNRQQMHTLFAYEFRPTRENWSPPLAREPLPVIGIEELDSLMPWQDAA